MKRFIQFVFVVLFISFCLTSCQPASKAYLEVYSNDETYITLEGEIQKVCYAKDTMTLVIKCDEIKEHIPKAHTVCTYEVFSDQFIDVQVGDVVVFVTSSDLLGDEYWLPIVSLTKNGITLLSFEEGKKNLIDWASQLQRK